MFNEHKNPLGYSYWRDVFEDIRAEWKKHIDIEFTFENVKVYKYDIRGTFTSKDKWETEMGRRYIDLCLMNPIIKTKASKNLERRKNGKLAFLDKNTIGGLVYLVRELVPGGSLETVLRSYTRGRNKVAKPLEEKTFINLWFRINQINNMVRQEIYRSTELDSMDVIEISCKTILGMEHLDQELQEELDTKGIKSLGFLTPDGYKNIDALVKDTQTKTISDIKDTQTKTISDIKDCISNLEYTLKETWEEEKQNHPGVGIEGYPATLSEVICTRMEEIRQSLVELEEYVDSFKAIKKARQKQAESCANKIDEIVESQEVQDKVAAATKPVTFEFIDEDSEYGGTINHPDGYKFEVIRTTTPKNNN